ncbi:DUF4435 domain-containing protein [Leisingera sp. NJS204]|uniref:DUF4435 domain-containing protein n=1 Tax=Leisingera sp. NJS204 TaxID=2508307 RepID=UPI0013E974F1|nr:DUF4435 domain-containing protein [Leisingera sp. NJS204]
MEDYADYLAAEAFSENAAVHEFIASYQDENEIHVFLEGEEDFIYYLPEIRRLAGSRKILSYNCGGKWNVVDARDSVEKSYNVLTLFFVDRDYDDLLSRQATKSDALYITDGYSIENMMSSDEAANVLLTDILAVPTKDANRLKDRMQEIQCEIRTRMYALAAWILAAKDASCSPNLNNTNSMGSLLKVTSDGRLLFCGQCFLNFKRKVDSGKGVPPLNLQVRWYRAILPLDFNTICRGKYHAWIFSRSAQLAIKEENDRRKTAKKKKIREPESLAGARVVELLAGRVPYPPSLTEFLESRLG